MQTRVQFANIQSFQPVADYRKTGSVGVIEGRNFSWDVAGVVSDFASRLIHADTNIGNEDSVAYELRGDNSNYVAVGDKVFKFTRANLTDFTGTWSHVDTLTRVQESVLADVPLLRRGFTSDSAGNTDYISGWNYGVYEVDNTTDTFTRLTSATVSGFPVDSEPVIAIGSTNGRMLYLTATALYYSEPNQPKELVPSLGGAGFQILGEVVGGNVLALTPLEEGAIIWTSTAGLVAEFIGGDLVFRYYLLTSDNVPVTAEAITRLADGTYIILTRNGLFQLGSSSQVQPIAPIFSAFLRSHMLSRPIDRTHLWYSGPNDRLYVSIGENSGIFLETFVLDITLDRWGVFSDSHKGMFRHTIDRKVISFMHPSGVASYFLPVYDTSEKAKENPFAPGTFAGLGSRVDIGYVRAEQIANKADSIQELQEIVVHRSNPIPGFRTLSSDELFISSGGTVFNATTVDEGLVTGTVTLEVDEGEVGVESVEPITYFVSALTDLAINDPVANKTLYAVSANLANQGINADTWTLQAFAMYFALRFEARNPGDFFRINGVDCTLADAGQMK